MTLALPILRAISRRRITEIMSQYSLDESELPSDTTRYVTNVNSSDTVRYIKEFAPDVVLVNGTRIIRSHVLECTDAPFINTHAGVTPMYRGVHGGYWALWNQDHRQFGATVHLVDKGVDTGTPISFATTVPDRRDNFCTYPLLQQAISLPGIQLALEDLAAGKMLRRADSPARFSRQWYHPTLWGYASGLLRGVK
ncbi:MAG: hypothetical protein KDA87_20400 [Planctomycetales bacterium]|nr:hypothetical protein [Planctomycetales bacterium]